MKIAYIVHPIAGDVHGNIEKILAIVKKINLHRSDVVPFAPYIADVLALDDNTPEERSRGIENDVAILKSGVVNELWVYGSKISGGMKAEIELAFELNIPIVVMEPDLKWPEWLMRVAIHGH
jgi:hypothetical protein